MSDLSTVIDPNRWQPLTYLNGVNIVTPGFVGAQWNKVTPFAMTSTDQFLISRFGPALFGSATYSQQAEELIALSAGLTDTQKIIAEWVPLKKLG